MTRPKGIKNKAKVDKPSKEEKLANKEKDELTQTVLAGESTIEVTQEGDLGGDGNGLVPDEVKNKLDEILEVGIDSISYGQKLGVLQRIVTAVIEDKEYRQVLLTAAFDNKQEALLCADAIAECKRYGVSIEPLIDRVIAQCSVKSGRVNTVLEALTHYTLNTNYGGGKLPLWKRRQDGKTFGRM